MITNHAKKDIPIVYIGLSVVVFLFAVLILFLNYINVQEENLHDKMYPNVIIDGKNAGYKTKDQIINSYAKMNTTLQNGSIEVLYHDEKVATFSADKLNLRSDITDVVERAFLIGRSEHTPTRLYQKMMTLLNLKRFEFKTSIIYDRANVQDTIASLEDQYNTPAKNALFTFEDGRVVSFREDEKGLKINSVKLQDDFDKAVVQLKTKPGVKTITLTDSIIKPEVTLSQANKFGIEELIGEGQSDFTHSSPERIHNLTLAASKFNGVLIEQGKVISYNDIVGDISTLTGYVPGYIIKNGKTVLGDGGGVCQVSTTLFRAGLNTGLPVLERTGHAYRVIYYENDSKPGLDATTYSPTVDLKLQNDTPAAILIQTQIDADTNILHVRFYGKKDGRQVYLSPITTYDEQPAPPPLYQDDATLKRGEVKQVDFPASGIKSTYNYKVTKNDQVTFEKTFLTVYRPWQAIYLVGTQD